MKNAFFLFRCYFSFDLNCSFLKPVLETRNDEVADDDNRDDEDGDNYQDDNDTEFMSHKDLSVEKMTKT